MKLNPIICYTSTLDVCSKNDNSMRTVTITESVEAWTTIAENLDQVIYSDVGSREFTVKNAIMTISKINDEGEILIVFDKEHDEDWSFLLPEYDGKEFLKEIRKSIIV